MSFRDNRGKEKAVWRQFAQTHNLRFVADGDLSNGAYVTGSYRRYALKLESFKTREGKSGPYTRITISWLQQAQPVLSLQEALSRFNIPSKYTPSDEPKKTIDVLFKEALDRMSNGHPATSAGRPLTPMNGYFRAASGGQTLAYEEFGIIQNQKHLEFLLNLLMNLSDAYPIVLSTGTEFIPTLINLYQQKSVQPIIKQLLQDMAQKNYRQLTHRAANLLCPNCLTRFDRYRVQLLEQEGPLLYGCRTCLQSHKYLEGTVIAVLYTQLPATPVEQDGLIRVNWLIRRELFDFDAVEIVNASDEEVERFAVQVGNDTDEFRRPRYREMGCMISPNCGLAENSLRILRRTFGQVAVR